MFLRSELPIVFLQGFFMSWQRLQKKKRTEPVLEFVFEYFSIYNFNFFEFYRFWRIQKFSYHLVIVWGDPLELEECSNKLQGTESFSQFFFCLDLTEKKIKKISFLFHIIDTKNNIVVFVLSICHSLFSFPNSLTRHRLAVISRIFFWHTKITLNWSNRVVALARVSTQLNKNCIAKPSGWWRYTLPRAQPWLVHTRRRRSYTQFRRATAISCLALRAP